MVCLFIENVTLYLSLLRSYRRREASGRFVSVSSHEMAGLCIVSAADVDHEQFFVSLRLRQRILETSTFRDVDVDW